MNRVVLRRAALALTLFALPAFAGSQVWTVSAETCPDVDFATIQDAIDAAADGDTILVRPSRPTLLGPIDIFQKSLTIVVGERTQPFAGVTVDDVSIRGLLPNQSVTLIGIATTLGGGGLFEDNQGPVWIEDSSFFLSSTPYSAPFYERVLVEDCSSVTFVRSSIRGGDHDDVCPDPPPCLAHPGGVGLRVVNSEVHLYDCVVEGGAGGLGNDGTPTIEPKAGRGGDAIRLESSSINLYDSWTRGGRGGVGGQDFPAPFCSDGGDGGAAVFLADVASEVRLQDTTFLNSAGGVWTSGTPLPNGCQDGLPGPTSDGPGSANVTTLPFVHKVLTVQEARAVREGEPATLVFEAGPQDLVFLGVAAVPTPVFDLALNGTSAFTPLKIFTLGNAGATGTKSVPVQIGDVTAAGEAVTVYLQAYYLDGLLQLALSAPAALTILDATHDVYDGCSTLIEVDDDAPNDPGPGDPGHSDPLEDGTAAHPFDDIQEAINAIKYWGSTVRLADGTYNPPFNGYQVGTQKFVLASANGPADCTIDAAGFDTAIELDSSTNDLGDGIRGITFTGAADSAVIVRNFPVTIQDCVFENNSAVNGGGLRLADSDAVVRRCVFRSNTASVSGGALWSTNGDPTFESCSFVDNSSFNGGAISVRNGGPVFRHCTVANNSGGGLLLRATFFLVPTIALENCLVWGNTGLPQVQVDDYPLDVPYGNVQGGLAGFDLIGGALVNAGPGLIDADPLFVDPVLGDYHLSPLSPCIDAGDPAYVGAPGETDLDGDPRVQGAAIDLGSDES